MRRILILSFILSFIVSTKINAQAVNRAGGHARVLSLGNNPYIIDPQYIRINPAWAYYYYDFLWADIGSKSSTGVNTSSGQFAGVNVKLNNRLTLGGLLTVNNSSPIPSISVLDPYSLVNQINSIVGSGRVVQLNNNFELLASFKFDKMILGLAAAYSYSQNRMNYQSGNNQKGLADQFGLNAGILAHLNRNFLLDAGASLILPNVSYNPGSGFKTKLSQTIFLLNARGFINASQRLAVVPAVNLETVSGSAEANGYNGDLQSVTNFSAGVGVNYRIYRFLIAGGVSINYNKTIVPEVPAVSPQLNQSGITFPVWNLGAEWSATRWLIARIGYQAATFNNDFEQSVSPNAKVENIYTGYNPGTVTLGIGLRFGGFGLDATLDSDVLRQGLNNIGGGTPTFAYISTSYAF